MRKTLRRALPVLVFIPLGLPFLQGHSFTWTDVEVRLLAGRFRVRLVCDLDALALGVSPDADSRELARTLQRLPRSEFEETADRLKRLIRKRIRIRIDGQPTRFDVILPDQPGDPGQSTEDSVFGTSLHLEGVVPERAREMTLFASRAFPPVRLAVIDPAGRALPVELLQRGETSPPFSVQGEVNPSPILQVLTRYVQLGFTHILPLGLDHILFVLGLFLFRIGLKPLLLQVSAFTLAHTLTLGLGIYGVVSLPARPVEALIALSIVYVAVENVIAARVGRVRLLAVFGFGLLHGLGFAGVAAQLGLPAARKVLALFSFNLGVELGQITVLSAAFLLLGPFRKSPPTFRRISLAGSVLIGAVGAYWFWQRLA